MIQMLTIITVNVLFIFLMGFLGEKTHKKYIIYTIGTLGYIFLASILSEKISFEHTIAHISPFLICSMIYIILSLISDKKYTAYLKDGLICMAFSILIILYFSIWDSISEFRYDEFYVYDFLFQVSLWFFTYFLLLKYLLPSRIFFQTFSNTMIIIILISLLSMYSLYGDIAILLLTYGIFYMLNIAYFLIQRHIYGLTLPKNK